MGPGDYTRALITGFKTSRFELDQLSAPDKPASFAWKSPDGALAVTCALFLCPPEFVQTALRDQAPTFGIVNYDECVLARQVFTITASDAPTQSFEFTADTLYDAATATCPGGASPASAHATDYLDGSPRVTALLTGCWAYDATGVIGATDLQSLTPAQVPLTGGTLPVVDCSGQPSKAGLPCLPAARTPARFGKCTLGGDCGVSPTDRPRVPLITTTCNDEGRDTEDKNCFPSAVLGGFGTCLMGSCLERCALPTDCDVVAAQAGDNALDYACCVRQSTAGESAYLGVCVPPSFPPMELANLHCAARGP